MKYLFFDIECCDGTHICSLGYVIIDKNFHILEKQDLIINPELPIRLGKEPNMKLFYSKSAFNNSEPFPAYYKTIINLLTKKHCTLVGFAIENDFNFINIACHRYNLPQCKFKGFDVQKLEKVLTNEKCVHSLEKVADAHNIPHGVLNLHKSCDDAQLTMYILRNICFENNLNISEILALYKQCFVQSKFYVPKNKTQKSKTIKYNKVNKNNTPKIDNNFTNIDLTKIEQRLK